MFFCEDPTDDWNDTTITAEAKYFDIITQSKKNIRFLHYNVGNSFSHTNNVKVYQFKAREIFQRNLQSKHEEKTGSNEYMYDFSVGYDTIDSSNIWI